jgi:hypothetical protein
MPLLIMANDPDLISGVIGIVLFILVFILSVAIYFTPTFIALVRKHPNGAPIFLVNFLLGWICIGWIIALIWSLTAIDEDRSYR